jgi:hypothetical protein
MAQEVESVSRIDTFYEHRSIATESPVCRRLIVENFGSYVSRFLNLFDGGGSCSKICTISRIRERSRSMAEWIWYLSIEDHPLPQWNLVICQRHCHRSRTPLESWVPYLWTGGGTGETQLACETYSVPKSLQQHIDFVLPTIHLQSSLQPRGIEHSTSINREYLNRAGKRSINLLETSIKTVLASSPCWKYTTIDCLRTMYHIPISNASDPDNSLGTLEYSGVSWLPADLESFFTTFMPSMVGYRPMMELVDGGY